MEIKWIKTFIITAKYENFRKTSEELFLTQPAVTKHVRRLEEYLNIQLFDRIGNRVTLTPAGYRFLFHAKEFMAKYEQGMEDFESWKQGYKRKLVIAVAPQIASSFLPRLLRLFIEQYPEIEVIINIVNSYNIGEEVSGGRADLGLSRILPYQTNLKIEVVHRDPVIFVGPNDCQTLLEESSIIQKYRLITHNHPDYWDHLLNQVKKHYPKVQTMAVNGIEVSKRFIEEGLGVSYLPRTMVMEEILQNRLVELKPDKINPPESSTYLLTKIETQEVQLFERFLGNEVGFFVPDFIHR